MGGLASQQTDAIHGVGNALQPDAAQQGQQAAQAMMSSAKPCGQAIAGCSDFTSAQQEIGQAYSELFQQIGTSISSYSSIAHGGADDYTAGDSRGQAAISKAIK